MPDVNLRARAASYKDVSDVPEPLVGELLDGDVFVSPRPAPTHSHTAVMLTVQLVPPFQHGDGGPGGWRLLYEPELYFHGDVMVPDLAGWRSPRASGIMERANISQPPDWVCEITSPSTEDIDRGIKAGIYAREGVRHLWLVDPTRRTLEVQQLAAGVWVPILTLNDDAMAAAEPFDAVPFPLTRIWPERQ